MIYKTGYLNKLISPLILFCVALNLTSGDSTAGKIDSSLSNLYENLLQREYAGPISFPNHQVERKAQRSPSLRLRFGRSDPDIFTSLNDKRWFGDVNQKPIRSPSLRLRFGRRSDPLMMTMSNDNSFLNDYNDIQNDDISSLSPSSIYQDEKDKRKQPSFRLRFGRSLNPNYLNANFDNYLQNLGYNENLLRNDDEKLTSLAQVLFRFIQEYDENPFIRTGYNREVRKPAALRLRWGRSTGGIENDGAQAKPFQSTVNSQFDGVNKNSFKQENKA